MNSHEDATYDVSTDTGKIRLLISDVNMDDPVFNDAEIEAFFALGRNNVFRAAAHALRAIAGNEMQVLKVIRMMELETDAAKLANAMLNLAKTYDDEARNMTSGSFKIAQLGIEPTNSKELRRRYFAAF